ncbi:hypothetical protein JGU66_21460 [Myxococcaceae bacterium JPH2]|nr:hypothetical protein [Myxococcaceae bacterium JPH2]
MDLRAACSARLKAACDYLHANFKKPKPVDSIQVERGAYSRRPDTLAQVIVECELGVDGRLRPCEVLEKGPLDSTEVILRGIAESKYSPSLLAGHPISMPHVVRFIMDPTDGKLQAAQELLWRRARAVRFPQSPVAWSDLAEALAKEYPSVPEYLYVVRHMNELYPEYWWSANELAWSYVSEGRYAEALPLARRAQARMAFNPYVDETVAAALLGLGNCSEGLIEQRHAIESLPVDWPLPERERFQKTLRTYEEKCGAAVAPAPSSPQGG